MPVAWYNLNTLGHLQGGRANKKVRVLLRGLANTEKLLLSNGGGCDEMPGGILRRQRLPTPLMSANHRNDIKDRRDKLASCI